MNTDTVQNMQDIMDIKGLEHFTYSPLYYIVAALLVVGVLYLAWWFFKKSKGAESIPGIEPQSPDEIAIDQLDALKSGDEFDRLGERKFNFRLSEIFRLYLEARFQFFATDMTTEEVAKVISDVSDLNSEKQNSARALLEETDMVKFAKVRRGKDASLDSVDRAVKFVEETREVKAEPENVEAAL